MESGEILRRAARRWPEKTALIAGERRLDYGEYDRLANRFANFLIAAGIRPGDRIATVLFNSPEYGVVHFGSARAGSVLVHIPPLYAAAEIAEIVERTRPRVLVVDAAVQDRIGAEVRSAVPTVMVAGSPDFEDALAAVSDRPPDRAIDPAAPVAMTFTGGTTGRPKGAVVSHTARYVSAASTAREHQVTEQDVVGVVVPMFHAVGLMIWYQAAILRGCTAVILRKWDPAEFIAATERHGISSVFLVPVQVRDLLRSPAFDGKRLASLKNIGVGGAPTPPGLIEECRAALPHCGYTDHYGQSETGPLTILKPWETEAHAGTVGRPAEGVELRIVDADGNPVPPGTVGELVTRGPYLMEGYFGDEEETARYFRDGWGWTGDLGRPSHATPPSRNAQSSDSTKTATSRSWAGPARSSSRAASTSTPPRSRPPSQATPQSKTAPSSASPTNAGEKRRSPTSSPPPTSQRTNSSPTAPTASPATNAPAKSSSSTPSPAPPPARSKNHTSAPQYLKG